ncbi:unnamed protein product, partial [Rotaria sordida]
VKAIDSILRISSLSDRIDVETEFSALTLSIIASSTFTQDFETIPHVKEIMCLNETLYEVNDLQRIHSWYNFNLIQIRGLKVKITEIQERYDSTIRNILHEIAVQKERAKEILTNALDQLETTINRREIKNHLNQLIHQIDQLVENMASQTLLVLISSGLGMFSIIGLIISLFAGTSALDILSFGIGAIGSGIASEVIFRKKLCKLDE